ncbi:HNH endonuclease [Terrabacter sp. MAHUQ-38]|nr:HNH endonuclease [Terrabacter sp. MAHUQ-38]
MDARGLDERRRSAARRRTAYGRLVEDGMGVFTVVASAERVVGVLDRADALARAARAAGDGRSLEQLRSDVLCDLALYGTVPPDTLPAEGDSRPGASPPGTVTAGPGTSGVPPVYARLLGQAPAAVVRIVVPFEVAAGVSDAACEIPGHGWVTAGHARWIMTAAGSVWQRLAVEVDSGRALELSTDCYRPTAAMVAQVRAVDGVCRAPGCQVPAERCDLDHVVPWPRGETRVSNFESLSRVCHNGKTAGAWTVERVEVDGLRWTSLAGREYITYPRDWREALRDPGSSPPASPPDEPPREALDERSGASAEDSSHAPPDDPPPF